MKRRDEFTDHRQLVAEWNDYLEQLSEKHGKKAKKKKSVKHPKIQPKILDPNIAGLRVRDDDGNVHTIEYVDPEKPEVVISEPTGEEQSVTPASLSNRFKVD